MRATLVLIWVMLSPPALAIELPLRAFTAKYDLYQSGMHIATAQLSLQPSGEAWRWVMQTKTRGMYSWFIDSRPYAETTFTRHGDALQLQRVIISDAKNKKKYESANFDWRQRELKVLRKGKHKSLPLTDGVYDYQSIHVLAATMHLRRQQAVTINFYRKGRLLRSRLLFSGEGKVSLDGKDVGAIVFEQVMLKSNSKMRYYYDAENPLLPLRIEKLESGGRPTVMTLKRVDWTL